MNKMNLLHGNSAFNIFAAVQACDGTCDPDFDADNGEWERQFAEIRVKLASE